MWTLWGESGGGREGSHESNVPERHMRPRRGCLSGGVVIERGGMPSSKELLSRTTNTYRGRSSSDGVICELTLCGAVGQGFVVWSDEDRAGAALRCGA